LLDALDGHAARYFNQGKFIYVIWLVDFLTTCFNFVSYAVLNTKYMYSHNLAQDTTAEKVRNTMYPSFYVVSFSNRMQPVLSFRLTLLSRSNHTRHGKHST
jgi:hypothetical protein